MASVNTSTVTSRKKKQQPSAAQKKEKVKQMNRRIRAGGRRKRVRQKKRFGVKVDEDMIIHASGATGTDIRVGSREVKLVGSSSISVPQEDPTLNVNVRITQRSIAYLAAGIVLRALNRGWPASATSKTAAPYYAFRYLVQSFINSMQGTFPTLQSAPRWFWELNAALLPKTERFKTGRIAYTSTLLDEGAGLNPIFPLGTDDYTYSIFWGLAGSGLPINGYAPLEAPASYTETLGEASIQGMFEFFEEDGLCKRSGAPDPSELWMTHDTSAFAAVYAEMGASYFNPCGSANTVQSERHITSPMFAKFCIYQDTSEAGGSQWRGWHAYHRSAGTPFYLAPRLSEMFYPIQMRNKVSPIFKWFNFDEIFNVLSLTVASALERLQEAEQPAVGCPLTSQQAQIMLRQAILPYFCNEMAQDLRLQDQAWVPFLPFVVGPNGCSQGNSGPGPELPKLLAENIRCMKRIVTKLKSKNAAYSNMELDVLPILGRPSPTVIPQLQNYLWGTDGAPLYAAPGPEVPINLIDASAVDGSDTVYLDLNGPTQALLVQRWNEWILKMDGCLVGLANLSTDRGCEALSVLPYTSFQQKLAISPEPPAETVVVGKTVPPIGKPEKTDKGSSVTTAMSPSSANGKGARRSSIRFKGLDVRSMRKQATVVPGVGSETFQRICFTQTTGMLGFTSELWKYLGTWILPVALTIAPNTESDIACYCTNVIEPFTIPASASNTGVNQLTEDQNAYPLVYDRNLQFAQLNVKAWNSPTKSEMEVELDELTKDGKGGFFTKIAGIIGDSLGIEGSSKFMNSVGDMTGL